MTHVRLRVCRADELGADDVKVVPLPQGADRKPREAIILRNQQGEPRAYVNRCRHLPVPIDAGSREFLTRDKEFLLCGTHGALFQREDGLCVAGPCLHLKLEALELEESADELWIVG